MEKQNAEVELGVVLYEQRRFAEAQPQFASRPRTIQALATADPDNNAFQQSVADTLAWLADSLKGRAAISPRPSRSAPSTSQSRARARRIRATSRIANNWCRPSVHSPFYAFAGDLTGPSAAASDPVATPRNWSGEAEQSPMGRSCRPAASMTPI